ncbi:MAG: Gfo/Idh/MocA family oxidoreductase [Caldilineaceae bacterium]
MNKINFGMIGGGWRADFFLKVAEELPERFQVSAMMVRDAAKGAAIERRWGVKTYRTLDETLAASKDAQFMAVSVPWQPAPDYLKRLSERGIPALCETPPAPDLPGLIQLEELVKQGAKIQVAEQYAFQPLHAARLAIVESGRLGTISQAQVSIAHGYHGINLMRRFLGVGFEPVTIRASKVVSPLIQGPNRSGPPSEEKLIEESQTIAHFEFANGKLGIFDFMGAQYFSWIRGNRLLVRGERGEIEGETVRWLHDFRTPIALRLQRHDTGFSGNLEGMYHRGYTAGAEWVYQNPFIPGRLTDDEIAVADCLQRMAEYVAGGPEFYGLADAAQDHYLNLLIGQAIETGQAVKSEMQWWCT